MEISVTFYLDGKANSEKLIHTFTASVEPPYLGVILKPGRGIWEYMKNHDDLVINLKQRSVTSVIKYRIDVGESSIFFLTSEDQSFREIV
ncbi:MAG: hypothetical protein QW597_02910 [Thermoplasmataceae archaeon]